MPPRRYFPALTLDSPVFASVRNFVFLSLSLFFSLVVALDLRLESNEVDRLLAKNANFAAWTRVTDDPDSMLVAKSIGDYLG